ncbi:hypothetical protein Pcinc_027797 [Petrolisthes cinctipes]|uniref:Uncharacterized protein n=1 Tax=Petrolisthes cinctipes TaxID=88211 RepID=A0AAE1F393_PETCI|nr:hypothetical protein Pcinc_027797 [Petrolisthes cinctipes]
MLSDQRVRVSAQVLTILPPLLLLLLPPSLALPPSLGLDPSQMSSPTTATDAPSPLSVAVEDVAEEGTIQNYAATTTIAALQDNQEITTTLPDNTTTQPKVTLEYKDTKNRPVDSLIGAEDQVGETGGVEREKGSVVWTKMKENGEREWRDVNEWGNGKTENENMQAEVKDTEVKDGKGNEEDWVIGMEEEGSKRTDSSGDAEHNKSFFIDDDNSSPKNKGDMDLSIIERFLLDSSEDSVMLPPNESSALGSLSDFLKNTLTRDTKMAPPEQDDPVIVEAKEEYMNIWNREAGLINAPYLKVTKVWPEMGMVYMPLVTEMSDRLRSSQPVKEALERYKAIWRERNAHTAPSPSTSGGPILDILGNFMGAWSWLNSLTESRVDVTDDDNNNTGDVNDKDDSNTLHLQNRGYTGANKVIIDPSEGDGWQDKTTSSNKESFKNYYYIPAASQSVSALHPLWYPPNPSRHPHPTHRPLIPLHQDIPLVPGTRPTPILPITQGNRPSIPIPVHKPGVIDADGPIGTAPSHTPPICPVAIMPSPVSPIHGSGPTGVGGGVSDSILPPSDSISPPPRPFPIIKPIISSLRPVARPQPRPAVNQIPSLKRAGYPATQFTPVAANRPTPAEHTPIARHTPTSNTSVDPEPVQNPVAAHRPAQNPIANHRPVQNPVAAHRPVQNPVANHRPVQNPVAVHRPVQNPVASHRPVQNPVTVHRPVQNPVANHRPARDHFAYHSPDSQHFVVHVPEGSGIDYPYSDTYYNEYQSPRDFIVTSTVQYPAQHHDYHTDPSAFYIAPTRRSEVSSGVPHRTGHHGDNYQRDLGMQSYSNPSPYESTRGSYDLGTDSGSHESDTNTSSYESRTEDMISFILQRLLNPKTRE